MMTATEQIEARKLEAEQAQGSTQSSKAPEKPSPAVSAPAKTITAAPAPTPGDGRNTVTITLDPAVHEHFSAAAKQDERSLAKFLARHLRMYVEELKAQAAKKKEDENF
jgi:uncharacterized protein (DUF4415 family)